MSRRGVIRGIHFAEVPPGQAKYVVCVSGAILDVIVDVRVGSPGYGRWAAVRLDDADRRAVFLSEGLGHAFMALSDEATVIYLCSTAYAPGREHGVNPFDPEIGIAWPAGAEPVLSGKDAAAPTLQQAARDGMLPAYADCLAYRDRLRRTADGEHPAMDARAADRPSACRRGLPLPGGDLRERLLQCLLPVPDRRYTCPGPGAVAEHAVGGAWRWPGQCGAGDRPDPGRVSAEQPEDLPGQPEPGGLPGARGVVDAGTGRRMDQGDDLPGHIGGPGGLAVLVVDDLDGRAAGAPA